MFALLKARVRSIEAGLVLATLLGASLTLILGGMVHPNSIQVVSASKLTSPPYGELTSNIIEGYVDNFTNWTLSEPNAHVNASTQLLEVTGTFRNSSTWASVNLFESGGINISEYPLLSIDVNVTTGVRYGIRFYSQYIDGSAENVWWEGSPLDHRPGIGVESIKINMEREALLATGARVATITKMQLYIEDPPDSPQSFRFDLSRFVFEKESFEALAQGPYDAVYFGMNFAPQGNLSWYLNKVNIDVAIKATQGTVVSIYFFDGPTLFASSTATGLLYNSLIAEAQYTFYPDIQPLLYPDNLPESNVSIVFVALSGALQGVTLHSVNFEFFPTGISPNLSQHTVAVYYIYFLFFLFLLPLSVAVIAFRGFSTRSGLVPKSSIIGVIIVGLCCRFALGATTTHVVDTNVYLASARGWFQFGTPVGSFGPTLPFTFFLYWTFYSPFAMLQMLGFHDIQFLGHTAGLLESVFIKLFPIMADLITFLSLSRFGKTPASFVWATFYFLNPWTIFTSSVWGQYEAASTSFIIIGVYWLLQKKTGVASLAFVVSGMIELLGFLPLILSICMAFRKKLYKTTLVALGALVPVGLYPLESLSIFRYFLGFLGFNINNNGLAQPGRFSILANFSQLSFVASTKPLLLSEAIILGMALVDIYRHNMPIERMVLYTILASVAALFFANLIAFWFWLLPLTLLYVVMMGKGDLGGFMLVFGTTLAFLEVTYAFGSSYLILGSLQYVLVPAIEGTANSLKILSTMTTMLSFMLLYYLKYGSGRADHTLVRTSAIIISSYLLVYFWFGVYPS